LCNLSPMPAHAQTTGQWAKLTNLPIIPIHDHLLPNGKVLMWGRSGARIIWDPATQAISSPADPGYDQFCAGHTYLADGRLFVPGGHVVDFVGLAKASLYNPANNTWSAAPDMNAGRWYPTATELPNGDALVIAGQIDTTVGMNALPQVYQTATNSWRNLTGAQLNLELYPTMFLAPNGKVINIAPAPTTRYLDTSGTGAWSFVGNRTFGSRDYGSGVMYADGKIMIAGGGDPPTATAEVIDLNAATPAWRSVASMSVARRHLNATLLPDGTVLATGGSYGSGFNNTSTPAFTTELWDPATEKWTTLASASVGRFYHSSALLLPDGRVLSTGGENTTDVEIFSPPYLFKGARPAVSGAPASIGYGQRFTVQSPDAASIAKVTLIRLASVTHAFNQNQRINILQFTPGSGTVDITTPANANLAPPGDYMLFAVNTNGVPSIGTVVRLSASAPTPPPPSAGPPTLASLSPNNATAGGPAFTLTVNGSNFVSGASVLWNGSPRATSFVGASQVTAAIPAADIAATGTAQVSAMNPGSSASNALPFTVAAAVSTKTLSVTKTGTAVTRGTVTSSPAGISCGSTCSAVFATNSNVTLRVVTNGNGVFAGWSGGGCSGTGVCTVTMDVAKTVTATINRR
jgi:hypothetical protein